MDGVTSVDLYYVKVKLRLVRVGESICRYNVRDEGGGQRIEEKSKWERNKR